MRSMASRVDWAEAALVLSGVDEWVDIEIVQGYPCFPNLIDQLASEIDLGFRRLGHDLL